MHIEGTVRVAHHFESLPHQRDAATFGMWLFLAQEVMFFGALFAGYAVYRVMYPVAFDVYSRHTDILLGTINTGVLLTSSLTMALAVHAAREGKSRRTVILMLVTAVLGLAFMAIKGTEYYHDYEEGLMPGARWTHSGPNAPEGELFFRLFFITTGLHGLHVLIGILLLLYYAVPAARGKYGGGNYTTIDVLGLYWHFVDLVWIFVFPLYYLVDRT